MSIVGLLCLNAHTTKAVLAQSALIIAWIANVFLTTVASLVAFPFIQQSTTLTKKLCSTWFACSSNSLNQRIALTFTKITLVWSLCVLNASQQTIRAKHQPRSTFAYVPISKTVYLKCSLDKVIHLVCWSPYSSVQSYSYVQYQH